MSIIIIHPNLVLPTIPLLQHPPSHYHYATQCSRLVFASQARCHCPCPPCQLWKVSHHTSPQTLHSYYYLPRPGVTNHTSPATFSTSVSQNISTINDGGQCAMYLRPGATLSCMKFSTTPPPHGNNTSRSIFGQKPVSLSMSSLPVVGSVPPHLSSTHLNNTIR